MDVQARALFFWKELFHLGFMIRGQIDWSHFVFSGAPHAREARAWAEPHC